MKYRIICFLLLMGVCNGLQAQDKLVLRSGQVVEVKVQRSTADAVQYTYPGETVVFERPKSVIAYIQYADGRRENFSESSNTLSGGTSRTTTATPANTRQLSVDDEIFWQDVKTTFTEAEVKGLTRLQRISAASKVSYKDAIQQLKKKAADLGGTTILLMDIPENDEIEIMGIAYRDEKMSYVPRTANERNAAPVESSANVRRRQIASQMESYNNESDLEFEDYSRTQRSNTQRTTTQQPQRTTAQTSQRATSQQPTRTTSQQPTRSLVDENELDAVYLMNGRVIRGTIEEFEPDEFISIRTTAGRVNEFSIDDVRRFTFGSAQNNNRNTGRSNTARSTTQRNDQNDRYSNNNRASSSRNRDDYEDDYVMTSGYKGFFDIGYDLSIGKTGQKGSFEFNTSHGYQINPYFFAGAGLGLHINLPRDSAMKNMNNLPHYPSTYRTDSSVYLRAVDSSFFTLPIFIDVRAYLPLENSKITPFFMFRLGYAFNLSDGFKGMGLYMNPAIGAKMQLSRMLGVNFSIGYAYQSLGGIPKNGGYGYYYFKDASTTKYEAKGAGGISLKLGVEF